MGTSYPASYAAAYPASYDATAGARGGARIVLSSTSISEAANIGDLVGTLSVVNGDGTYAFSITADPDNKFVLDVGDDTLLELEDTLNYSTATSHIVTIQADNGVDPPISRSFTIQVIDVVEIASGDAMGLLLSLTYTV